MKISLLLVAIAATLSFTYADDVYVEKRDISCDSILAVNVCDRFEKIATTLKLKANAVEEAIKDAYNKGITKAEEVKTKVEKFLEEKILSKKCEDLVDKKFCDKLDVLGQYLQKKGDELKPYIVKAMLQGAALAKDIKNKVEHYIKNDLMTKTCDDVLTAAQCQKIKDIGNALKMKAEQIKKATIESMMKGYKKAQDTVMVTLTTMKKYAENFTCEELLNPNVCITIRDYANKLRIAMPKMMNAVRSAIVMGYKVGKGFLTVVYKIADAFIDCEQFLSHENCEKMKAFATKVGTTAAKVKDAIVDAVKRGVTEAKNIYKSVLEFFKNKFGRRRRSLMGKRDLTSVLQKYRELLKKGIQKAEAYLKQSIANTLDALKVFDQEIRSTVEKAIVEGKKKHGDLKKFIAGLLSKDDVLSISKRAAPSLRELLKKALSTATGYLKWSIEKLLAMTNGQLQIIKRYVQAIVDKVIGESKRDVESSLFDNTADSLVEENLKKLSKEFSEHIEDTIDSVADDAADLMESIADDKRLEKRFIDVDIKDLNLKEIVTTIITNNFGKIYEKLNVKTKDLIEEIKETLKKAGNSMIDVSKVILSKMNEMMEKLNAGPDL